MKQKIQDIQNKFISKFAKVNTPEELEELRVEFLGKKGYVQDIMSAFREIPNEEKREVGKLVNELKTSIETSISEKKESLLVEAIEKSVSQTKKVDITMPVEIGVGSLHPRTIVQAELEEVFKSMGFVVETIDEIVSEFDCFDAVNVPSSHPARDMQDTFWLDNGELLSTQTSSLQNAVLRKYGKNGTIKAIFPGRCFRNEALDHGHENTFFQMEGMVVDKNVSVANLIYFMKEMLSKVFGKEIKVRLRPGFFPFVEPGFELDVFCPFCDGEGCSVCKHGSWIELCPCGMIHPTVLRMGGVDPEKYSGFAFGLGLDRLAMIKSKIDDIRHLNSGNLKFLKQFGLDF